MQSEHCIFMLFVHVGGRGREEGDMDGPTAPPCGQRAQNTLQENPKLD